MMYRIETTSQAATDRNRCFDYIAKRSSDGALRWLEAYESAVESLQTHPFRGFAPENVDHEEEIRQCLFKTRHGLTYRFLYTIRDRTIYILHVRGAGQDLLAPDDLHGPEDR